jgi:DHA2 family multidrug resistance protein
MLSFINIDTNVYSIFWPLIIRGAGMGFMFIPLSIATLGAIPRKDIPAASGFFNLTRQMGGSIGVAMLATVLEQRQVFHYGRLAENISIYNPASQQFLSQVQSGMMAKGYDTVTAQNMSLAITQRVTQSQAMVLAFQDVYVIVAWIFVCTIPLIFFLGKGAKATRPGG